MAHRVVIVGGGFGGLNAAQALRRVPVDVTLIDARNFHLFQPLLYQVATGALSPANIAAPLRTILERQRNCCVLLGEVRDFDLERHLVIVSGEQTSEVPYDSLIVAAGSRHSYFGHPEWESFAPGLKTIEDATEIRQRVLMAFEQAERSTNPDHRRALLNFAIVGGGPTGVELAGALAEIAHHSLEHEFRSINPGDAKIRLIEAGDRVLETYPPELSTRAKESLEQIGVEVCTGARVTEITADHIVLTRKDGSEQWPTKTVIWAAGVQASPLAKRLAEATGATLDRAGRIAVEPDLTLKGHPEVFVIGDMGSFTHQAGKPLPGVATTAIQQGRYAAKLIAARLANQLPLPPFRYRDLGSLATIGRRAAVADFGKLRFSGVIAWYLWLFIHLMKLINFRNRLLVFLQWGWNYLTYDRSARLITWTREIRQSHDDIPDRLPE